MECMIEQNKKARLTLLYAYMLKVVEFDELNDPTTSLVKKTYTWNKYNLGELMELIYTFSVEDIVSGFRTYFEQHAPDRYRIDIQPRAFKSIFTYDIHVSRITHDLS